MTTTLTMPTLKPSHAPYGRARWCTVRVDTTAGVYVGRLYVTDGKKRLSDVLCDDRPFLSMTDVTVDGGGRIEEFVAINKNSVRTVRILQES